MKMTHVDKEGKARMVDVGSKPDTERQAIGRGHVKMSRQAYDLVRKGHGPKGDVFAVAKIAGIMGAKKTAELVPLCHPLAINFVDVVYDFADGYQTIGITSTVRTKGPTGVEMEAITAVMITALTIYDMCKAIDRGVELGPFYLLEKSGGKSGIYRRPKKGRVTG